MQAKPVFGRGGHSLLNKLSLRRSYAGFGRGGRGCAKCTFLATKQSVLDLILFAVSENALRGSGDTAAKVSPALFWCFFSA